MTETTASEDPSEEVDQEQPLNYMLMIPHRIREHIQKEWQVGFEEPRFKSTFWNRFFVFLGASENLMVRLDKMGSEIYGYIDGERNVRRILSLLELKHPDKENLRDRLVGYLKRLEYHEYIELKVLEKDDEGAKETRTSDSADPEGRLNIYALPQEREHPPRLGIDI